jgi:hypothetical protein
VRSDDPTTPGRAQPGSAEALLQQIGALSIRMHQEAAELRRGLEQARAEGPSPAWKLYWAAELWRLREEVTAAAELLGLPP